MIYLSFLITLQFHHHEDEYVHGIASQEIINSGKVRGYDFHNNDYCIICHLASSLSFDCGNVNYSFSDFPLNDLFFTSNKSFISSFDADTIQLRGPPSSFL